MVRSTVAVNPGGYSHVTKKRGCAVKMESKWVGFFARNPLTWVPLFLKNKSLNFNGRIPENFENLVCFCGKIARNGYLLFGEIP